MSFNVIAQPDNDLKARSYYFEAIKAYDAKNYHKAVEYCEEAISLLKKSNARIEVLKAKAYYNIGDIEKAEEATKAFALFPSDNQLNEEIAPFVLKIDEAKKLEGIQLFPFKSGEKFGFKDGYGKIIIPAKYGYVQPFNNGLARVWMEDHNNTWMNKVIYLNKTGNVVFTGNNYSVIDDFSDGLAWARLQNSSKFGFLDTKGNWAIPAIYDYTSNFTEGLCVVEVSGKRGYINKSGKIVISPEYKYALPFSEGLAEVITDEGSGFIDRSGNMIIPPQFQDAEPFHEGIASVEKNGGWGAIDKDGNVVIEFTHYRVGSFEDGVAVAETGTGFYVINKGGKKLTSPMKYKIVRNFSEGLAVFSEDGKTFGYLDRNGTIVIPPQFTRADYFNQGVAFVTATEGPNLKEVGYYINKRGEKLR